MNVFLYSADYFPNIIFVSPLNQKKLRNPCHSQLFFLFLQSLTREGVCHKRKPGRVGHISMAMAFIMRFVL